MSVGGLLRTLNRPVLPVVFVLAAALTAPPAVVAEQAHRIRGLTVTVAEKGAVYVELVATGPVSARGPFLEPGRVVYEVGPVLISAPLVYPVGRSGVREVRVDGAGGLKAKVTVLVDREVTAELKVEPAERVVLGLFPRVPEPALAQRAPSSPAPPRLPEALPDPSQEIRLVEGHARLFATPGLVRVAISNPKVADVVTVTDRQLLLNGLAAGESTLVVWLRDRAPLSYTVRVLPSKPDEREVLLSAVRAAMPQGVTAAFVGNALVLSGYVGTQYDRKRAVDVAKAAAKDKAEVVDLIEVRSPVQVMLSVRVAEIELSALKDLGVEWGMFWPPQQIQSFGGAPVIISQGGPPPTTPQLFLFYLTGGVARPLPGGDFFFRLGLLVQRGKARILATPNIVAMAGQEARLVVGGQIPLPTGQGGVEYKPFGVVLNTTPEVSGGGRITLKLEISNSDLDFSRAVTVQGASLPTLIDRRVSTSVSLMDGETLGIGGLVSHITQEQIRKIPILGDIPIIGELFKSRSFQERRTQAMFFVTPQILKPAERPEEKPPEPERIPWGER